MGWQEDLFGQAMGQQPGLPSSPFGGPIDPFGAALGETGLPGAPSGVLPPNPFGSPGAWPAGVPNPFGLPSPAQIGQTIGGWFTNPYGTNGSVPNPSPYSGINPYGTQVSGGINNPWRDPGKPNTDPYFQNAFAAGGPGGFSTSNRPNDPFAQGDTSTVRQGNNIIRPGWNTPKAPPLLKPQGWTPPQHSQTLDRWGGGWGSGILGQRHQQGVASVGGGPNWHDVPWGSGPPARQGQP